MAGSEKIKVIIVDDIAETRENIRKLLQFENDVDVIGVARTGKEGIDLSKDSKPDVVLMDINMPDMDGITATEMIRKAMPFIRVVILSVQSDSNYMRRAMLAGATDFLAKPPTVDELTGAIRRAGKLAQEERAKADQPVVVQSGGIGTGVSLRSGGMNGRLITVYSPKGGTGCTVVATNLAISLNNEETPVIIVDGNLQFGDVANCLNEHGKFSVVDLAPRVEELEPEIVESVIIRHAGSGVKILAAPASPEYAENVSAEQFGKILDYLRRMYSYVIVDTTTALSDITLTAIDEADVIVLLTSQDIPAIKNVRLFLNLTDAMAVNRKRFVFVLNKYDKRIEIAPERISANIKQDVVAVIPLDERVILSVNRGVPVLLIDKARPISRALLSLSEVIRQRLLELETQEEPVPTPKFTLKKK